MVVSSSSALVLLVGLVSSLLPPTASQNVACDGLAWSGWWVGGLVDGSVDDFGLVVAGCPLSFGKTGLVRLAGGLRGLSIDVSDVLRMSGSRVLSAGPVIVV